MAKHFEICRNIEKDLFEPESKQCVLDWNKKEHHLSMDVLLIKWADISNEARPLEVATKWTDCLLNEFFRQVSPSSAQLQTSFAVLYVSYICSLISG